MPATCWTEAEWKTATGRPWREWTSSVWEQKWERRGCDERKYPAGDPTLREQELRASVWPPGNSHASRPSSWMDNSELVAAVSFVIDRLLFHGFSPESLANGLRRGVDVIGSFVAAIDKEFDFEPWEQLSPTEPFEFDLRSEQTSSSEEAAAVVSQTFGHSQTRFNMPDGRHEHVALKGTRIVYTCTNCATKFAEDMNASWSRRNYCSSGCRNTYGTLRKHGSRAPTEICHRALAHLGNMPPSDADCSNAAYGADPSLR